MSMSLAEDSSTASRSSPNYVKIFDTTLRDGEQSPGCSLNRQEKVEIALALQDLGVDIIEAGFPIASPDDFDAVRAIAQVVERSTIAALARCVEADIERAADAVRYARKPRVHVFLATSAIHLEYKLKKSQADVMRMAADGVNLACRLLREAGHRNPDVEFSPEDASRTDRAFLLDVCQAAVAAGATTLNIPDTVGYAMPQEYGELIAFLCTTMSDVTAGRVTVSTHCHNDLGLAVANSIEAIRNGARQVECTINGIGERAGNAALEEVVMATRVRGDLFGIRTGIDARRLYPTSRLVSSLTGVKVQRNKAIVGENAFAHESGIHQHGMLAHRETYEIMDPAEVGVPSTKLVLGKHSGRHAFRDRLKSLGYHLDDQAINDAFEKFKRLADRKKNIYDDDLIALVEDVLEAVPETWGLVYVQIMAGGQTIPTATVRLKKHTPSPDGMPGSVDGDELYDEACTGDGPVDAAFGAMSRITGVSGELTDYQITAVTGGQEAQGQVNLEITFPDGRKSRGLGVSTDIIEASAKAYLQAINRVLIGEPPARQHPQRSELDTQQPGVATVSG